MTKLLFVDLSFIALMHLPKLSRLLLMIDVSSAFPKALLILSLPARSTTPITVP
jgi:hypothetical protein